MSTAATTASKGARGGDESPQLSQLGQSGSRALKNNIATGVMWVAFIIALIPLGWILATVLVKGGSLLLDIGWWTESQRGVGRKEVGGGAAHAIQGTLLQALVTALIAVPIGVMTAVYLVEYGRGKAAKVVSFMVDILTGVPSIVAALFIYAIWVTTFGLDRIPFAVCLALVLLMIPVVVRSTEEMLKLVPNELREASYALGVPKWKTIMKIVLPTAFSGIVTGVLLGLARVMGETAPLIILAPYFKSLSTNLFDGLMGTLPTMIYNGRDNMSVPESAERVWAAACTLILLILVLNLLGRLVGRFSKVKN